MRTAETPFFMETKPSTARLAARDRGEEDFVLLDVREPTERAIVTIPGARTMVITTPDGELSGPDHLVDIASAVDEPSRASEQPLEAYA